MANFIIGLINALIKGLGLVLSGIAMLLPPSPFQLIDNSPIAEFLGGLNYFVPISFFISSGTAWLTAIGLYYIAQIVMRWLKAIE